MPVSQIQHRDLRVLDAAVDGSDREEDRLASGQELGPQVIAFARARDRAS